MSEEKLELNKIYLEDCMNGLKKLESQSAQCIIADPPYNVGKSFGNNKIKLTNKEYVEWAKPWLNECRRILMNNGTMFIFGFSEIVNCTISVDMFQGKMFVIIIGVKVTFQCVR